MSIFTGIRGELQLIADSMCAVTGIDITIVDDSLMRIVGTGPLGTGINQRAPAGSAFEQCLITGRQYFIRNPRKDVLCRFCENRDGCQELAELCIPIKDAGKTIGVLGMCAFQEEPRRAFVDNHESFLRFEDQLSSLIVSVLGAHRLGELAEYRSQELTTLLNSLSEGIVILSPQGELLTVNLYLQRRLGLDSERLPPLHELVAPRIFDSLAERGFTGEAGPVTLGGAQYLITASPILVKKQRQGVILIFSDFDKMKASVLRAAQSRDFVTFDDIVGESETILHARRQAMQIAGQDVSVLLCGETGTGKEIFARAIHTASRRGKNVFMPLNCGAIPEALIESELFGHEKGAFTGAAGVKPGLFEICGEGTLFLDEIGELPLSMQVKLLRAIEEKEIRRVGGVLPLHVNPRVISATHRDLSDSVKKGTFREDLFYRLNVVPIVIPPLRERGYDIIVLARHFLEKFCAVYGKNLSGFSSECERLLLRHSFPGNIRELRNLIEYAVIFEERELVAAETILGKLDVKSPGSKTLADLTRAFEREAIERSLAATDRSLAAKRETAQALGISLTTLYRKLGELPEH